MISRQRLPELLAALSILRLYCPNAWCGSRALSHPFTFVYVDTGPIVLTDEHAEALKVLGWVWARVPYPSGSVNDIMWTHGLTSLASPDYHAYCRPLPVGPKPIALGASFSGEAISL